MTNTSDCTVPADVFEQLIEGGFAALPDAARIFINTAMLIERQKFIGAEPYRCT